MTKKFHFEEAFSRSLGWLTEHELQLLRGKRIAIAGVGGVGGSHLLTLARLGIGAFHIADSDIFELGNFNRQVGATMSTIGQNKAAVMAQLAKDINPELDILTFGDINESNIEAFLTNVDVFIDGIDAFAVEAKRLVFKRCADKYIPATTAGPFGTGSAYINFMPGHMTFEEYFAFDGLSPEDRQINFFTGVAPAFLHRKYIADPSLINLRAQRGMTTPMACQLSSAIAGTETLKILLGRGKVYAAPYYQQYDPYLNKLKRGKLRMGMKNPHMLLKRMIIKKLLMKMMTKPRPTLSLPKATAVERIMEAAHWTPSGDNYQPWTIQKKDEHRFTIEFRRYASLHPSLFEIRSGMPNVLSAGMMLENIKLAASAEGMTVNSPYTESNDRLFFDITLTQTGTIEKNILCSYISIRSVNRKKYKKTLLSSEQKAQLATALGDTMRVSWYESAEEKLSRAKLNAKANDIRLKDPDSYTEINKILDWDDAFSSDRIPVHTLPLSALTRCIMRWAVKSWSRVHFLNTYLNGTMMPKLEMDILPGINAGAHFVIEARHDVDEKDTHSLLAMGGALQRFWLTATRLGLAMQPSYATLVFAFLGSHQLRFSKAPALHKQAEELAVDFANMYSQKIDNIVFMGRIGIPGRASDSRSLRKPL